MSSNTMTERRDSLVGEWLVIGRRVEPWYNSSVDHAAQGRISRKLRLAFRLHEEGVSLMRQNLRRRHPDESETEVDTRLLAWLHHRPGAEYGDAAGRPVELPRRTDR